MKKPERIERNKAIKVAYEKEHGSYKAGERIKGSDLTIKSICKKHDLTASAVYLILKSN